MELKDMKLSPEEAAKTICGCGPSDPDDLPKYPYGLQLYLDDETLAKLGVTLPDVGGELTLSARVMVCSTSEYANQEGTEKTANLQITAMALQPKAAERDQASTMYPSMGSAG